MVALLGIPGMAKERLMVLAKEGGVNSESMGGVVMVASTMDGQGQTCYCRETGAMFTKYMLIDSGGDILTMSDASGVWKTQPSNMWVG